MSRRDIKKAALAEIPADRVAHVRGVMEMAVKMAKRYGVDPEKAETAAALHDITKKLSREEQLKLIESGRIPCEEEMKEIPNLLHSVTGAWVAKNVYGVDDDIAEAVRTHTTGGCGMSDLAKIIFLADTVEPNRNYPEVEELRRICMSDLDRAMAVTLRRTIMHLHFKHKPVYRSTVDACEYYEHLTAQKMDSER